MYRPTHPIQVEIMVYIFIILLKMYILKKKKLCNIMIDMIK